MIEVTCKRYLTRVRKCLELLVFFIYSWQQPQNVFSKQAQYLLLCTLCLDLINEATAVSQKVYVGSMYARLSSHQSALLLIDL